MTDPTNDPPKSLTDTSVGRLADEITAKIRAARKTPVQRASAAIAAVPEIPRKAPVLFWGIGIAVMAFGFWRMEAHKHGAESGYVHLGSDWLILLVGIAFVPGAGQYVGAGLKSLGGGIGSVFTAVVRLVKGVRKDDK